MRSGDKQQRYAFYLILPNEFMPNLEKKRKFGMNSTDTCRPVRAKALKYRAIYKAFALTGRLADCYYTQGDALG